MGSQPSTRRTHRTKGKLKQGNSKSEMPHIWILGFLKNIKRGRKARRRDPLREHGEGLLPRGGPSAHVPTSHRGREYPYHLNNNDRHVAPVSNTQQFEPRGRSRTLPSRLDPAAACPHSHAMVPSHAYPGTLTPDHPLVYPQVAISPTREESRIRSSNFRPRHKSRSPIYNTQLGDRTDRSAGPFGEGVRKRRHNLPHGPSRHPPNNPADHSMTTYECLPPERSQPSLMTTSSRAKYHSKPDQPSMPPTAPVALANSQPPSSRPSSSQPSARNHSRRDPRPVPQAREIWRPPESQQADRTRSQTHRVHRSQHRASQDQPVIGQLAQMATTQRETRNGEGSMPAGQSSRDRQSSNHREVRNDDRDRHYDRREGEMAAERRVPKSSRKKVATTENTLSVATAPTKFYRPGDPNHPSVKPISSDFKRRHGYRLGGVTS